MRPSMVVPGTERERHERQGRQLEGGGQVREKGDLATQGRGGGEDSARRRSSFGGHGAWRATFAGVQRERERCERREWNFREVDKIEEE